MSSKVVSKASREPGRMGSIMRWFPSLRNRTLLLGRENSLEWLALGLDRWLEGKHGMGLTSKILQV